LATVNGHKARIEEAVQRDTGDVTTGAVDGSVQFDSGTRALEVFGWMSLGAR
jgi:hypothetical protein